MSKRARHAKFLARREARTPLPASVDLIEWVRLRERMSRGMAKKVIMAGSLKVDSHIVGVKEFFPSPGQPVRLFERCIPSDQAFGLEVVTPKMFRETSDGEG